MSKELVKKVGNNTYRIHRIPPFEAIELVGDLQRVFGPAIAAMAALKTSDSDSLNMGMISGILMDSAEALGRNLDGKMLRYIVTALIREDSVYVQPKSKGDFVACGSDSIDLYADIGEIMEVAVLVLQHNYKDFFGKVAALIGKNMEKGKSAPATAETASKNEADPLDD